MRNRPETDLTNFATLSAVDLETLSPLIFTMQSSCLSCDAQAGEPNEYIINLMNIN